MTNEDPMRLVQIRLPSSLVEWIDTQHKLVPRAALLRDVITEWAKGQGYEE